MQKRTNLITIDEATELIKNHKNIPDDATIICKGFINATIGSDSFNLISLSIESLIEDACQYYEKNTNMYNGMKEIQEDRVIINPYDLMTGESFLDEIRSGCIIDEDGSLANIIVDGYISDIGLVSKNRHFMQGDFLCEEDMFKELCDEHTVLVNWANK